MKANEAPEKIFLEWYRIGDKKYRDWVITPKTNNEPIQYTRTDAFVEKALKWYCLDCECNDNCKDSKCFFHNTYKRYLEGDTKSLPPKFSDTILNEDGSTSDNWRYRHFTSKMQDAFIEKACEYLNKNCRRFILTEKDIEDFKNYMKGK